MNVIDRRVLEYWCLTVKKRARTLAEALVDNVSDHADTSDYQVVAGEGRYPHAGTAAWTGHGIITRHYRRQSVRRLVERVAVGAASEAEKQD